MNDDDTGGDYDDYFRLKRIKERFVNLLSDGDQTGPAAVVIAEVLRDELAHY